MSCSPPIHCLYYTIAHKFAEKKKAAVMPQKSRYEGHPGEGRPVASCSAGHQLEPRRPLYRYTLIIENLDSYTRAHYIRKVRRVAWQRADTGFSTPSPPARKRHVQRGAWFHVHRNVSTLARCWLWSVTRDSGVLWSSLTGRHGHLALAYIMALPCTVHSLALPKHRSDGEPAKP